MQRWLAFWTDRRYAMLMAAATFVLYFGGYFVYRFNGGFYVF